MNPIAAIHGIVGFIMIVASLPLIKRKIKRNPWYGVRIPEAFKSEERWLEINQYGGRLMLRLGVAIVAMAGIGLVLPPKFWVVYAFAALAIMVGGLGIVITLIFRYARRTKKA